MLSTRRWFGASQARELCLWPLNPGASQRVAQVQHLAHAQLRVPLSLQPFPLTPQGMPASSLVLPLPLVLPTQPPQATAHALRSLSKWRAYLLPVIKSGRRCHLCAFRPHALLSLPLAAHTQLSPLRSPLSPLRSPLSPLRSPLSPLRSPLRSPPLLQPVPAEPPVRPLPLRCLLRRLRPRLQSGGRHPLCSLTPPQRCISWLWTTVSPAAAHHESRRSI